MPSIYGIPRHIFFDTEASAARIRSTLAEQDRYLHDWVINPFLSDPPTRPKTVEEKIKQLWIRSSYFKSLPKKFSAKRVLETKKKQHLYYRDPRATW